MFCSDKNITFIPLYQTVILIICSVDPLNEIQNKKQLIYSRYTMTAIDSKFLIKSLEYAQWRVIREKNKTKDKHRNWIYFINFRHRFTIERILPLNERDIRLNKRKRTQMNGSE